MHALSYLKQEAPEVYSRIRFHVLDFVRHEDISRNLSGFKEDVARMARSVGLTRVESRSLSGFMKRRRKIFSACF